MPWVASAAPSSAGWNAENNHGQLRDGGYHRHGYLHRKRFTGSIRTLALKVKALISRVENPSDKGSQCRILAGNAEIGAAWQKPL